jgi:hypothetical protein
VIFSSFRKNTDRKSKPASMHLFSTGLVYFCLLCMLNILFFAPVEYNWVKKQANGLAHQDDPDNSLLEMLLEDYLDAPESTADPQDDADHLLKKLEYVSQKPIVWTGIVLQKPVLDVASPQPFFVNPFPETLTPPPKHAC